MGYADLLIDDPSDSNRVPHEQKLRAIRQFGREALEAIDETLIRRPSSAPLSVLELESMAAQVARYSGSIVQSCLEIERLSEDVSERSSCSEELAKVRDAAMELAAIALRATVR
ncbi:hypothetical protein P12x_004401 [Tundrisphaera lichenicola]|uniref:hypothetical protein n=1 Tax=Tundrisphaera lichenicola TaxID=2029860 RepID=UPI003EBEFA7B